MTWNSNQQINIYTIMKKFLIICAAAVLAASCTGGKGYTVKGVITGDSEKLVNGTAYIVNRDMKNPVRDTAEVINGKFVFKGTVQTPEPFLLSIDGIPGFVPFFLENTQVTINGVDTLLQEAVVTGGPTQTKINRLNAASEEIAEKYDAQELIRVLRSDSSGEERDSALAAFNRYQDELSQLKDAMVAEDPMSEFSLYFTIQNSGYYYMDTDSLAALVAAYQALPQFEGNKFVAMMDEYLQDELKLGVGNKAPDFTLNTPDGKSVTLSEFYPKNKVTMIDFWASWCGPCRAFNPTLVEIYKKYHKLGFDIIGVSLDRDHDAWVKGIKDDKLTWTHVSDLKFWQSEVGQLYHVSFIPQNTFVDAEGNIIGRKVSEEDLESFLDEHLK